MTRCKRRPFKPNQGRLMISMIKRQKKAKWKYRLPQLPNLNLRGGLALHHHLRTGHERNALEAVGADLAVEAIQSHHQTRKDEAEVSE